MPGGTMERPMRADARRNYERIVATAKDLFTAEGADVPLTGLVGCGKGRGGDEVKR